MKQGDVYLRKEDNRMYSVAMANVQKIGTEITGLYPDLSYTAVLRPLHKEGESLYFVEDNIQIKDKDKYSYQYNLFDRVLGDQEA